MKNVDEFIKKMVKIEYLEDFEQYGHYPFQLFAEMTDGRIEINSLALGGNVESCLRRFANYRDKNAKRIYMSLDFPSGGDIKDDFIVIYSYESGILTLQALPYKTDNGEILETIKNSTHLEKIKNDLRKFL